MMKFVKNFKSFWLLELALFGAGFYLVYNEFIGDGAEGVINAEKTAIVAGTEGDYQEISRTILETAVVCLDVDVEEKKPLLAKGRFSKHIDVLFCYTEISGKIPDVLIHDWIYGDTVPFRQRIVLNGEPRVWTKMSMSPEKTGTWRVDIRTESGEFLGTADFVLK